MLPLEVIGLPITMRHPEGSRVRSAPAQRSITKTAAEQNLHLIVCQPVVFIRDEGLRSNRQVFRCDLAVGRENRVVRRCSETTTAGAAPHDLKLKEVVRAPVLEPIDDPPCLDATRGGIALEHLNGHPLVHDLADLLAGAIRQ